MSPRNCWGPRFSSSGSRRGERSMLRPSCWTSSRWRRSRRTRRRSGVEPPLADGMALDGRSRRQVQSGANRAGRDVPTVYLEAGEGRHGRLGRRPSWQSHGQTDSNKKDKSNLHSKTRDGKEVCYSWFNVQGRCADVAPGKLCPTGRAHACRKCLSDTNPCLYAEVGNIRLEVVGEFVVSLKGEDEKLRQSQDHYATSTSLQTLTLRVERL